MFSQGLFIIIVPCLIIVVLICWAWFPFWIFVKAFQVTFGIRKAEDRPAPVRAEENDKCFPAESLQPATIQPPVLEPPVVRPTAFDPEYFQQHNDILEFDPGEAKRRLVFRNRAENEGKQARKGHSSGDDEVEAHELEDPGSQGLQRKSERSQRRLPPLQPGDDPEGLQSQDLAATSDLEARI